MGTGKDETCNGRILLAQFSHQVNHSSQGMSPGIDDLVPQEVAKMPHRTIVVNRLLHCLPQTPQSTMISPKIGESKAALQTIPVYRAFT
jgi:hypothetical protein